MKRLTGQLRLPKRKIYVDVLREVRWLDSAPLTGKRLRVPAQ